MQQGAPTASEPARPARPTLLERFWMKVQKSEGCWLWIASVDKSGYGQIASGLRPHTMLKAHRVSWEIANGPIADGLFVLHRCDVRRCVNPAHLFLGTHQDNMDDMNRKHRNRFQRNNPSAKLSDNEVIAIRARRARGETLAPIASDFGVTIGTVSRIASGVRRAGVPTSAADGGGQ